MTTRSVECVAWFNHLARGYFTAILLWLCLTRPAPWLAAGVIILLFGLIVRHDQGVHRLRRLGVVLPWLLLPTFMLHALFTPGEVLWSGAGLHVTREGLASGMGLALHLALFFLCGMMIARLWPPADWLMGLRRLPVVGHRLYPLLLLLEPLRKDIVHELAGLWRARRSWRALPSLLEDAVRRALALGREHAERLWLTWDERDDRHSVRRAGGAIESIFWLVLAGMLSVGLGQ
ncbi:MAG: hypothetical protein D6678_00945 [Zetaproteobacteria bacterium]|nr:MAG: hypothetical protein D6678_00945 [Zetaproteobacteria bacterium]